MTRYGIARVSSACAGLDLSLDRAGASIPALPVGACGLNQVVGDAEGDPGDQSTSRFVASSICGLRDSNVLSTNRSSDKSLSASHLR